MAATSGNCGKPLLMREVFVPDEGRKVDECLIRLIRETLWDEGTWPLAKAELLVLFA